MMNYNHVLVNADTDSFMVTKPDGSPWSEEEQEKFRQELNKQFPEKIVWEHDGLFSNVIVVKSKNYVLKDAETGKVKIKGSSLKDQKKEKKLLEFIGKIIDALLADKKEPELVEIYNEYIKQACQLTDSMAGWCKKVTVTSKITKCKGHEKLDTEEKKRRGLRKNETSVYDALQGKFVQEGDKIYVFFNKKGVLTLEENFKPGDYSEQKLVSKIYSTLKTFKNVIDIEQFPKYHLKKNNNLLQELLGNVQDIGPRESSTKGKRKQRDTPSENRP
jgi:DNA polymerase elongation subunit (family B)